MTHDAPGPCPHTLSGWHVYHDREDKGYGPFEIDPPRCNGCNREMSDSEWLAAEALSQRLAEQEAHDRAVIGLPRFGHRFGPWTMRRPAPPALLDARERKLKREAAAADKEGRRLLAAWQERHRLWLAERTPA